MRLSDRQKKQIKIFREILMEKNRLINLLSRKEPSARFSFLLEQGTLAGQALSPVFQSFSGPVLDIGSGNGFPGLLFAVFFPKTKFLLCEKKRKKAEFLKLALSETGASNGQALCQRAEEMKGPFSLILSQAALPLDKMLKLLNKILDKKGQAFLWQSSGWRAFWPETQNFIPEVFKAYKTRGSQKILLKVTKA